MTCDRDGMLKVSIGQCSIAGKKPVNQDFHGAVIPEDRSLEFKGIAVAIADGISTSEVSHVAAETAVKTFLTDYYCTSDAWSAKTAGARVLHAVNAWLHSESRRQRIYDNQGYICTFSALVLKGRAAHVFHLGDSRVYRLSAASLEQLTTDHRMVLSATYSYLARALGLADTTDIEYRALELCQGDVFVLTTDGVHEFVPTREMAETIASATDLDHAARQIVARALGEGSTDNLTISIVRVDDLPERGVTESLLGPMTLPAAEIPRIPYELDGYQIVRQVHVSSRSHIFVAMDRETGDKVAIKVPASDLRQSPEHLRRFAMEEWIARRIHSPHVLRGVLARRERSSLYSVTEFIEGQTLRQWMNDNPRPDLETVRGIIEQITRGLRAFHRKEMLHQDLRPENIMIDRDGTVRIIDFGSVRIAGVLEAAPELDTDDILGTHQYTAPEYFLGLAGTTQSDLFSLGVIGYEMLTGRLPYGDKVARATSPKAQATLVYNSASALSPRVPDWMDWALRKAVYIDPVRRYQALSEFAADLRQPSANFDRRAVTPIIERNPLLFWQAISAALLLIVFWLLATR